MSHEEVQPATVEITGHYLRNRNALALRVGMEPIYTDYYLHLMQHALRLDTQYDNLLKDALAAVTLHAAARPRDETNAWTVHYPKQSLNLFVTASSPHGNVTGRVFTDNVREGNENLFIGQATRGVKSPRQSIVTVSGGADFLTNAEEFYRQSQQLPARYFRLSESTGHETFQMIAAMPDIDLPWLESLTLEAAEQVLETEDANLLETRVMHFGCECTLPRIVAAIASLRTSDTEELFADSEVIEINCPRCGARYEATREDIEQARG